MNQTTTNPAEQTTEQQNTTEVIMNQTTTTQNTTQNNQQNTTTTEAKMNDNTTTQQDNQQTTQTTEVITMNANTNPDQQTAGQQTEQQTTQHTAEDINNRALVVSVASLPRSKMPKALKDLAAFDLAEKGNTSKAYAAARRIVNSLIRKGMALEDINIFEEWLVSNAAFVVEGLPVVEKKAAVSKAITYTEAVTYAKELTEGTKNRSLGVANALKTAALIISRHNALGDVNTSEAVGKALDSVYAACRRQAKKNGVDIGGKSNKPTKDAAKSAVLTILLRMIKGNEYKFDVIIGEA